MKKKSQESITKKLNDMESAILNLQTIVCELQVEIDDLKGGQKY